MSDSQTILALQASIESQLSEVNISMPGILVSYNDKTVRARVRPSLPKMLASGVPLDAPEIVEVPVVWPRGMAGKAGITFPLSPGDGMLLVFSQRSLEGWLSGQNVAPDDPRRFDLSDAVAVPGLLASNAPANATDAEFHFGPVKLRLKPDGGGTLETAGGNLTISPSGEAAFTGPRVTVSGDVIVQGDVRAGTISLRNHVHTGVQSGSAVSGAPRP